MTKLHSSLILSILAVCLVGCKTKSHHRDTYESSAAHSVDARLVGTFVADDAAALLVLSDGKVFYIRPNGDKIFVGNMGSAASYDRGLYALGGPDDSLFIGTQFHVSLDFSTILVDWRFVPGDERTRGAQLWPKTYHRKSDAP